MGDIKCPLCSKGNKRVLFRPHWSKKYHELICGHCKIEFSLIIKDHISVDVQLKEALDRYLIKVTGETMEQAVQRTMETMTEKEMLERLSELNATYH